MGKSKQLLIGWSLVISLIVIASGRWVYGRQNTSTFCASQTTLETIVECINTSMPAKDSEAFVVPSDSEKVEWGTTVSQMLMGHCTAITLPDSLNTIYEIREFTDSENNKPYCILLEIADGDNNNIVDRGWGTLIVGLNARRPLSIQVPHPKHDLGTRAQGISIFKHTDSHTFLMAGAHRYANSIVSSCQSAYEIADASHNTQTLFHTAVEEIQQFDEQAGTETTMLQFHSMASTSCTGVDVYLTYGNSQAVDSAEKLSSLQKNLQSQNPSWAITLPTEGVASSCNLHGNFNIQSRLINGVSAANVCTTSATNHTAKFIHIEQASCCRDATNWIAAIKNNWSTLHLPLITNGR